MTKIDKLIVGTMCILIHTKMRKMRKAQWSSELGVVIFALFRDFIAKTNVGKKMGNFNDL